MSFRVFVCGQRSFGAAAFKALASLSGVDICGVAAPRNLSGRPDRLWSTAELAGFAPLASEAFTSEALPGATDLIVAAHSHSFISRKARLAARLGAIGYHPSLLPRHRGRDAVRWTIAMGDAVAGGSVYWLTDNVDAGDLAAQEHALLRAGDDAGSLWRRDLFPLGAELLTRVALDLAAGRIVRVPQDESSATWEPSWGRPPLHRPELPLLCGAGAEPLQGVCTEAASLRR